MKKLFYLLTIICILSFVISCPSPVSSQRTSDVSLEFDPGDPASYEKYLVNHFWIRSWVEQEPVIKVQEEIVGFIRDAEDGNKLRIYVDPKSGEPVDANRITAFETSYAVRKAGKNPYENFASCTPKRVL